MKNNYSPKGKYLWDAWFFKVDKEYHMFYLQAPRLRNPAKRHHISSIGHAISKDLIHWKELPTALTPDKLDCWDNLALWTGSVIEKDNKYYLFYTGRNTKAFWIQKIGVAISTDLIHWKKYPDNPIIVADERYYHMDNKKNELNVAPAWRDPYVFKDYKSDRYYMTISASTQGNIQIYNGCIAIAQSTNLIDWEILSPILAPGKFDEMETSQVIFHNSYYYLFFSTWAKKYGTHTGLHCYFSDNLFGNYKPVNGNCVVLDNGEEIYDVRLLDNNNNEFLAIGWLNEDKNGNFIGELSHPFKITIEGDRVFKQ